MAFEQDAKRNFPEWPIYEVEKRSTIVMGTELKVIEAYREKERAAWDGLLTA